MVPMAPSSTRIRSAASFLSSVSTDDVLIFPRGLDIVSANSAFALPLPRAERAGVRGIGPIDYARDRLRNGVDIFVNLVVPESEHQMSHCFQSCCPIRFVSGSVRPAVD